MGAPRIFAGMIGTLVLFSITTYYLTGSFATTLVKTGVSAILLQVGYIVGLLFLVWKAARSRDADKDASSAKSTGLPIAPLKRQHPIGH